ncbi:MAG: hypothetical protein A2015_07495 [Spirochaetes bacterium GWF1_31_7]|nr:MAG: hypothetical protein A2Y30_02875 [Spirochaetes bacterium GWE1_32_154]OHD47601.1 MAG: hypothetical protein A2Y29_00320 [Spirochaetes bacterium GWE2_31_10]OHD51261.1 MAG: hypothetical protein A2015_07495 [Spirochaetes bacterium GWF1_31_7]OHD77875.1 MAG: hypothetical protein A2355_14625 [Spirochaetes bacterium RIFOXYB1_FULL_32_8]HBD96158.1 hypothetical protein [Spirochaetia bacterium]
MFKKMTILIFLVLITIFSCELPKDEVVTYDACNYISGFSNPKKISLIDANNAIVYDYTKGLIKLDLNSFPDYEVISGKTFTIDEKSGALPQFVFDRAVNYGSILPYDLTGDSAITLNPVDFSIVDNGTVKILYVLASSSATEVSPYLGGAFFVYKIDITDTTNIKAPTKSDVISLDSFPVSKVDNTTDLKNTALAIYATQERLYISGNLANPIRIIQLKSEGTLFDDSMIPDSNGNVKMIKVDGDSRKTLDPGVIVVNEDAANDSIFIASRNPTELGFHCYNYNGVKLDMNQNKSVFESSFPKSLKILSLNNKDKYIFGASYKNVAVYNTVTSSRERLINVSDDVLISDVGTYALSSIDYLVAAYNYKIVENKYTDYGYDHKMLYSGLVIYSDFMNTGIKKEQDIKIDGLVSSFVVVEQNGTKISLSASQNNGRIYINKLN